MSASDPGDDDPDARAAEFVLGTLAGEERAAFERELAGDAALRERVRAWEARLAPLVDGEPEIEPDARTWPAIAARLSASAAGDTAAGPDAQVVELRRALRRWRSVAVVAGALAACLAVVLAGGLLRTPAAGTRYFAVVNRGGELPALVVGVDTAAGTVQVRSLAAEAPAERSLELWYVGRGAAPRSLGVVTGARATIPAGLREADLDGASLAVSVEPRGGSPTGAPTGPVIYSGRLVQD